MSTLRKRWPGEAAGAAWSRPGPVALALCLVATTALGDSFLARLDTAIVRGSPDLLAELQAELGEQPPPDANDAAIYLWAYTSWRLSQRLPAGDRKRRKRLLKDIQRHLEDLTLRQPGDAEALALLGSVLGDRIDGPVSGMRLGRRASNVLEQAFQLAPRNPRVALQRGVGFYFTPKPFGGGSEKAEQELRRAVELYAREPQDQPWPNWGHLDALARLGQVLVDLERPAEARRVYQSVLDQAPGYVWVRDELLPALDAAGS